MYAEAALLFPYLQGFPAETELHHHHYQHSHPLQEELLCRLHISNGLLDGARSNMLQSTTVTDYDLGGEGDLFKAPEPIIEEPFIDLYPVAAAISMMSNGDDVIAAEAIECVDIDSIQNEQPLSEVFYECKKDLLAKSVIEDTFSALLDVKIPALQIEEVKMVQNEKLFGDGSIQEEKMVQNEKVVGDGPIQKSVSSSCLTSLDWSNGGSMRPTFLDFQGMDLEAVFGMRRVYSEGDIQTVGNGNISLHPSFERMFSIGDYKIEERRQQLSRYRRKKTERNFGRKIKYACRKALADSQPRVRGRFAKTEDCEIAKTSK